MTKGTKQTLLGIKTTHFHQSTTAELQFQSAMKLLLISLTALLTMTISTFAGVVAAHAEWLSVETGVIEDLAKRVGAEVVTCYNAGTRADRAPIISVIDDWCNHRAIGKHINNGQTIWARYNYGSFTVYVSGAAINGSVIFLDSCYLHDDGI
ncbi:hypothetical protein DXG01_006211 [Tephrocybe rancida]|nr:hypothetical protein DXG01_006211 [Tephrocybe rancida]